MSGRQRSRMAARIVAIVTVILVVAAGSIALTLMRPWESRAAPSPTSPTAGATTVPVELGTLTDQLRLNATLGYGEPIELPAAAGLITALPVAGQVIQVGESVYESGGRPTILFEGARPFWRELAEGVEDGQDVLQLEQNLSHLGFFFAEPDTHFDWWTIDAVKRWQDALDLPVTGALATSDVVVVNAPSIRVSQVTGKLGQSAVSPATYTENTLRASANLSAAQYRELTTGTPVTVVLPDGTELESSISSLDPGGQPTGEDDTKTPPVALVEFVDQTQVAQSGPSSIRLLVQDPAKRSETLIVPAAALIATAKDLYAIEVHVGKRVVRVPVEIGLVADARVQILASGAKVEGAPAKSRALAEGDQVVLAQ